VGGGLSGSQEAPNQSLVVDAPGLLGSFRLGHAEDQSNLHDQHRHAFDAGLCGSASPESGSAILRGI
jgi:hypothetical protein